MPKLISKRGRAKQLTSSTKLSRDQMLQVIKCSNDPSYFINNFIMMNHAQYGAKPMKLERMQEEYLSAANGNKSLAACMPRMAGTTTISLGLLIWECLFTSNYRAIAMGLNVQATKNMCDLVQLMINHLPDYMKRWVKSIRRTAIDFENGSSLIIGVMVPSALRGTTFNRLFLDQFALAPESVQRNIWLATAPCVVRGARILMTSVPKGKGNTFSNIWHDAAHNGSSFEQFKRTIDDMNVTSAWQMTVRNSVGEAVWRREYMCEFE